MCDPRQVERTKDRAAGRRSNGAKRCLGRGKQPSGLLHAICNHPMSPVTAICLCSFWLRIDNTGRVGSGSADGRGACGRDPSPEALAGLVARRGKKLMESVQVGGLLCDGPAACRRLRVTAADALLEREACSASGADHLRLRAGTLVFAVSVANCKPRTNEPGSGYPAARID